MGIKLKLMDTDRNVVVARGKGVGGWGDRKWFDCRWPAHSAIYLSSVIEMYA